MKSEIQEIQFNNCLVELIQKLQVLAPEDKRLFRKYYKYYRDHVDQGKRLEFVADFVQYLSRYSKEFSTCDEGLFSDDDAYYPRKPIQLLKGIDFKKIWHSPTLTTVSKESLWKYFQTMFLLGSSILKENEQQRELLKKQEEILYNLRQNFKYEHQIKLDAERLNKEEEDKEAKEAMGGMGDFLDENNILVQIAMEVGKELKLSDLGGNGDPMQAISSLFSKDSTKLQEIIQNVSKKLTAVLKEKNLTEQELLAEAKKMHDKLLGKFKGIPGIENMIRQMTEEMTQCVEQQDTNTDTAEKPDPQADFAARLEQYQKFTQELTNNMRSNFEHMDPEQIEAFQRNLQSIMERDLNQGAPAPTSAPAPAPAPAPKK